MPSCRRQTCTCEVTPLPHHLPQVMDAVNISAFLQEASIMTRLAGGPHVVALHGACVDDQSLVVVMELLEVCCACLLRMLHDF